MCYGVGETTGVGVGVAGGGGEMIKGTKVAVGWTRLGVSTVTRLKPMLNTTITLKMIDRIC